MVIKNEGLSQANEKKDGKEGKGVEGREEGYELSKREKEWKEQMEAMRKRIEQDPYEAIFGKRFEPFWSPLVPSWMREEMGLQGWDKVGKGVKSEEPVKAGRKEGEVLGKAKESAEAGKKEKGVPAELRMKADLEKANASASAPPPSYSYASSTSWDSWTNKAKRVEWDSVSNQTKKYEYDPISNRMVQVEAPKTTEAKSIETTPTQPKASEAPLGVEAKNNATTSTEPIQEQPVKASDTSKAVNIPIKQSSDVRKSIPIPPPLSQPSHSIPIGFVPQPTSIGPVKSTALSSSPTKPSALSKLNDMLETSTQKVEKDIEALTANDVRASMGNKDKDKSKPSAPKARTHLKELIADLKKSKLRSAEENAQLNAILSERDGANKAVMSSAGAAEEETALDRELESLQRKKAKLVQDERGLFHIERQKRELGKLDERIREIVGRVERLNGKVAWGGGGGGGTAIRGEQGARKASSWLLAQVKKSSHEPAAAAATKSEEAPELAGKATLQPSLDRMTRSKGLPTTKKETLLEPDDSAAHESTEPLEAFNSAAAPAVVAAVPKNWAQQAELLQADRVRRTAGKRPARWMDDITARKEAYEKSSPVDVEAEDAGAAERKMKLDKANAMLEAETENYKTLMQAHEGRYKHKMAGMRKELDTAYKQSSVHSSMHLERMKAMEAERQMSSEKEKAGKRYAEKLHDARKELDRAYRQSAVQGEKHVERIRELEGMLREARGKDAAADAGVATAAGANAGAGAGVEKKEGKMMEGLKGEGDLSAGVEKFKDSGKWYKQTAPAPVLGQVSQQQRMEKEEQKARDRALVKEVREIYERRYGVIDTQHTQPQQVQASLPAAKPEESAEKKGRQVVEVESDVDLGEALAKYESEREGPYAFRKDHLEKEVAAKEREAHEGSLPWQRDLRRSVVGGLGDGVAARASTGEGEGKGKKLVDDMMPRLIPTGLASKPAMEESSSSSSATGATATSATNSASGGIQWQDPPVYKVLAYDSGNDMMSTATTTSNFTGAGEEPISIPRALSELYQPARFVPYFADLQREGYQVIFGTKDLLVFKMVRKEGGGVSLEDHGLVSRMEEILGDEGKKSAVNPVDGTALPPTAEPQTGNLASPTGSVKQDSLVYFAAGSAAQEPRQSPEESAAATAEASGEIGWRHYPRVRREEAHFTGTLRRKHQQRQQREQRQQERKEEKRERRQRRKQGRSGVTWALGAGLGAAGVVYLTGAAAEKARLRRREEEWARRAEEMEKRRERGRWWG